MTDLPVGWTVCSVRDIAESINPGFASGRHNSASEGVPHLRPMNVSRLGVIDFTEVKSVSADAGAKRLRRGDILFNNTNSPELVGKSATFDFEGDFAFSNHMTCVRPAAGVNPAFLGRQIHYLWMSGELRRFVSNHVNQASISSGRLADEVPLVMARAPSRIGSSRRSRRHSPNSTPAKPRSEQPANDSNASANPSSPTPSPAASSPKTPPTNPPPNSSPSSEPHRAIRKGYLSSRIRGSGHDSVPWATSSAE